MKHRPREQLDCKSSQTNSTAVSRMDPRIVMPKIVLHSRLMKIDLTELVKTIAQAC